MFDIKYEVYMATYYTPSFVTDLMAHFGGTATAMAKELGVTVQACAAWLKQGYLPANRAIQAERMTGGEFKAIDLAK